MRRIAADLVLRPCNVFRSINLRQTIVRRNHQRGTGFKTIVRLRRERTIIRHRIDRRNRRNSTNLLRVRRSILHRRHRPHPAQPPQHPLTPEEKKKHYEQKKHDENPQPPVSLSVRLADRASELSDACFLRMRTVAGDIPGSSLAACG